MPFITGINRPGGEVITYSYDSRGNRTQANVCEIDTSNFVPSEYKYNIWDELSEVRINGNTYSFEYDPEGLRTVKETSEESIRYHCDVNGLVIAESDATDTVTAQNIWGHKPLARKIGSNYYYYVYNGHGDVIQVLDESGNTVNSYQYDEWGNILSQQETVDNPLKYCGEYYDDESGLYYLRARYYDPVLGRFISKDSVEGDITNPLTLNRYAYCGGNPLIYFDPDGEFFFAAVAYGLAAGLGAVGVTAGTAKVADAITGTNNSSKIYNETKTYLTSSEAKTAYVNTGATVGLGALGRGLSFGWAYLGKTLQRFQNLPLIKSIEAQAITFASKHVEKITFIQGMMEDSMTPGPSVPPTVIKKK